MDILWCVRGQVEALIQATVCGYLVVCQRVG